MDDVRRQLVVFDRQGLIRKWHDRLIPPGDEWRGRIDERLAHSDVILLFVSPNFFDSDYCYEAEMTEAMRRHQANSAKVVPIILRPCAWESAPFASLQALPKDGRPITTWPNRDEACLDVAKGVMRAVRELRGSQSPIAFVSRQPATRRAFLTFGFIGLFSPVTIKNVTSSTLPICLRGASLRSLTFGTRTRRSTFRSFRLLGSCRCGWTWISPGKRGLNHRALPSLHRLDATLRFRARISTGFVFASRANPSVPPMGMVPGGPIS